MTINNAIDIFKTAFPNYKILSYKDLSNMYVFEAHSPEFDAMTGPKMAMDPWYYVEKQTGEFGHYYPFSHDPKRFFNAESFALL